MGFNKGQNRAGRVFSLLLCVLLCVCIFAAVGCVKVPDSKAALKYPSLEQMPDQPNTLRIVSACPGKQPPKVHTIRVYDPQKAMLAVEVIHWEVVSKDPAGVVCSKIVAGKVPDGFVQNIPGPGQSFVPIAGVPYFMMAEVDSSKCSWLSRDWIGQ